MDGWKMEIHRGRQELEFFGFNLYRYKMSNCSKTLSSGLASFTLHSNSFKNWKNRLKLKTFQIFLKYSYYQLFRFIKKKLETFDTFEIQKSIYYSIFQNMLFMRLFAIIINYVCVLFFCFR